MAVNTVAELAKKAQERQHVGLTPVDNQVDLAAADLVNGDSFLVYKFPKENCLLWTALAAFYVEELDSNVSPTGTLDIGIGDSDGVIDTLLYTTDYDLGTAAAWLASTGADPVVDVSDKYLIITFTAAMATAAAGAFRYVMAHSNGINSKTKDAS